MRLQNLDIGYLDAMWWFTHVEIKISSNKYDTFHHFGVREANRCVVVTAYLKRNRTKKENLAATTCMDDEFRDFIWLNKYRIDAIQITNQGSEQVIDAAGNVAAKRHRLLGSDCTEVNKV